MPFIINSVTVAGCKVVKFAVVTGQKFDKVDALATGAVGFAVTVTVAVADVVLQVPLVTTT